MKRIQGTVKLPYYKIERRMSKTQTWIYSQKHKREEPVHGTTPYPHWFLPVGSYYQCTASRGGKWKIEEFAINSDGSEAMATVYTTETEGPCTECPMWVFNAIPAEARDALFPIGA